MLLRVGDTTAEEDSGWMGEWTDEQMGGQMNGWMMYRWNDE